MMTKLKRFIPNAFTLGNLVLGSLAILVIAQQDMITKQSFLWSVYLVFGSMVLDFFDGFIARLLNVPSEIGVQLDSLADMVSFGLFPAILFYKIISLNIDGGLFNYPIIALLIVVGACYRLAKFNVEESDITYFKGLATPAMTLFVIGIGALNFLIPIMNQKILLILPILLMIAMNVNLPLFSFKGKKKGLKGNWHIITLLILSIALLIIYQLSAFAFIIPIYILLSIIARKNFV